MKIFQALLFLLFPLLLSAEILEHKKIVGAQIFVLDKKYANDIDKFFVDATKHGVNTVFFRVFHNKGDRPHLGQTLKCDTGVYYSTSYACTVSDLLPKVIEAGKRHNIKVYAWMATRSLSFLKGEASMTTAFNPSFGKVAGEREHILGYGADIFNPEIRQIILSLFKDLAKYDIDGILFQDDFIVKYNEPSTPKAINLFKEETGLDVSPDNLFKEVAEYNGRYVYKGYSNIFYIWARWKNRYLMNLFKDIKDTVRSINPKVMIAANVYYEAPLFRDRALAWYAQDMNILSKYADYFAVMAYHEQIASEQGLSNTADLLDFIKKIALGSYIFDKFSTNRVIMKLQSKSFKTQEMVPYIFFREECNTLNRSGDPSYTVVPISNAEDIITCD